MTASEDRVATQALNDMTFFFSNAVPQNGSLNSGQWNQLEARIRSLLADKKIKNARMITGGFFYDPAEDDPATADGVVVFEQIGSGLVAVPTHVYKIVVAQNASGEWADASRFNKTRLLKYGPEFSVIVPAAGFLFGGDECDRLLTGETDLCREGRILLPVATNGTASVTNTY